MSGGPRARKGLGAAIDAGAEARPDHSRLVDRSDDPADYGRWGRHWIWPALIVAGGTFGMVAGGVDVWRAALLSAGVAVALWSLIATMAVPDISWHDDVPGEHYHSSSTWEVAGLISARESDEAFTRYLRPRLWSLAETLLARRGIDPMSARARELIGPRNHALLTGEDTDPRHMTTAVSALCHAVAQLAVTPLPDSRPPIESPSLAGLAGTSRAPARTLATASTASTATSAAPPREG